MNIEQEGENPANLDEEEGFSIEDKELPKNLLIWWLTGDEQAQVTKKEWLRVPIYIKDELKSIEGRERRGRLWVPKDIELEGIEWDYKHPNTERLEKAGGIVFHSEDKEFLEELPGLITDLKLDTAMEEVKE